jgi:hypothetical protein
MTAGAAATQWPAGVAGTPLRSFDPNLPYQPRLLTPNERSKADLYVFYSPRNLRVASITEALNFALGLQFEFNPQIAAYVERPCRLILSARRHIDLSFWTRRQSGEERFHLTIPSLATVGTAGGDMAAKERDLLHQAAERQGLKVNHVFEHELVREGEQISTYFRLLAYVQSARRIAGRATLRDEIYAYLSNIERATFRQLHHILHQHDPRHVTTIVAAMIHKGEIRLSEISHLSPDSFLQLEDGHGTR